LTYPPPFAKDTPNFPANNSERLINTAHHERTYRHTDTRAISALTCLQIVEWAFGKRMTPAERLRKHQRALEKTQRELDRERVKLENQEKKLVADIKKSAKNGQMGPLRIQAKDLVRTRRSVRSILVLILDNG
jgi:charged multivesicular body protein 2A